MDTLTDINIDSLRRQVASLERQSPDEATNLVFGLATELRGAHRRAVMVRDQDTTQLVTHDHLSTSEVARMMCGHRAHADRVQTIVNWTTMQDYTDDADRMLRCHQGVVGELRTLLARTHESAVRLLPAARLQPYLPEELTERVAFCTMWARYLDDYAGSVVASRNLFGAVLVSQHHWDLTRTAAIAETTPAQIQAATGAARHNPPSEPDSGLLRELAALTRVLNHNLQRVLSAREEAIARCHDAGLSDRVVRAYGGDLSIRAV